MYRIDGAMLQNVDRGNGAMEELEKKNELPEEENAYEVIDEEAEKPEEEKKPAKEKKKKAPKAPKEENGAKKAIIICSIIAAIVVVIGIVAAGVLWYLGTAPDSDVNPPENQEEMPDLENGTKFY